MKWSDMSSVQITQNRPLQDGLHRSFLYDLRMAEMR